eukprot:evm.model.scf_3778.2 EVM.evm.TU.scf_3778.2   scf_3778:7895-10540(-)
MKAIKESGGVRADERVKSRLKELSSPRGDFGCKLLEDIRRLKDDPPTAAVDEEEEEVLAKSLKDMGYLVVDTVSALHSPARPVSEKASRRSESRNPAAYVHGYLTVKAVKPNKHDGQTEAVHESGGKYLVEPHFKKHFIIQAPTQRYSEVLDVLPDEYVGTADCLLELVKVLCREMAQAFAHTGRPLPPWRSCDRVWSKWKEASEPGPRARKAWFLGPGPWGPGAGARSQAPAGLPKIISLDFHRLSDEEVLKVHKVRRSRDLSLLTGAMKYKASAPVPATVPARTTGPMSSDAEVLLQAPQRNAWRHGLIGCKIFDSCGRGNSDATSGKRGPKRDDCHGREVRRLEVADRGTANGADELGAGDGRRKWVASILARYEEGWFGLAEPEPGGPSLRAPMC